MPATSTLFLLFPVPCRTHVHGQCSRYQLILLCLTANASYVHRLIQSKADGKLVELPGPETQIDEEIKEGILEVRLLRSTPKQ
jgi:hypothetical protein